MQPRRSHLEPSQGSWTSSSRRWRPLPRWHRMKCRSEEWQEEKTAAAASHSTSMAVCPEHKRKVQEAEILHLEEPHGERHYI
ncbi:hypothetical protein GDO78_021555 [Eleutherodactylus coqui]|uniref:Uncharacterized protein n=1 Tax=Eleutherodactylus coqui TaxID=57060 RepID=A0A8J6BHJ0_ELECQ|nr:hypothetical protein GDO78_021555 [Eleutherodactylus coqui]